METQIISYLGIILSIIAICFTLYVYMKQRNNEIIKKLSKQIYSYYKLEESYINEISNLRVKIGDGNTVHITIKKEFREKSLKSQKPNRQYKIVETATSISRYL